MGNCVKKPSQALQIGLRGGFIFGLTQLEDLQYNSKFVAHKNILFHNFKIEKLCG